MSPKTFAYKQITAERFSVSTAKGVTCRACNQTDPAELGLMSDEFRKWLDEHLIGCHGVSPPPPKAVGRSVSVF